MALSADERAKLIDQYADGPRRLREASEEGRGVGADAVDGEEGDVERVGVVVEVARPLFLVVALDQWILFGHEHADARRGLCL